MPVNPQKAHYERIHDEYAAHYYDESSRAYRLRFVLEPLLDGIDLKGAKILDLACGSGVTSAFLQDKFTGIELTGLDISAQACADYNARFGSSINADLTQPLEIDEQFDAAFIMGGIHHCVRDISTTMSNLTRIVKPGGHLFMFEPNAKFFLESVRMWWYRNDRYFDADTEHALDHDELMQSANPHFTLEKLQYVGGPAYYLIYNSLITRMPLWSKRFLAPILFGGETLYEMLPGSRPYPAFLARWRRV